MSLSPDLARILALPRRQPELRDVTEEYRKPGGTARLNEMQSLGLLEAQRAGGLVAALAVGAGKTLLGLLLPLAIGAKNTVLLVPPQLRDQLFEREYPKWREHFRLPNLAGARRFYPDAPGLIHVVAYSEISQANRSTILDRIRPDLIVADEAHSLRHKDTSRTRRFLRYMRENPETKFCAMSGTLTTRSLHDYAHLVGLALKEHSPLPLKWQTLEEWAAALDVSDFPADAGKLRLLCAPGETVHDGFRRRFLDTPGVIATAGQQIPTALYIHKRELECDAVTAEALATLRKKWCTPAGEELMDSLSMARVARQLACGVYLRWIYPRNEPEALRKEWLECRAAWHRFVRDFLKHSARAGLDSPLLVAQAAERGELGPTPWEHWVTIRDEVQPETEAVWISDYMVQDAVRWGQENTGIIWYSTVAVGQEIARRGGFPFFGMGDESAQLIAQEKGDRTVVASIQAQGTGLNLQAFNDQLITSFPSNGSRSEQLIGRTHRQGQKADEVNVRAYLHTPEMLKAWHQARMDAAYLEDTMGSPQKLRYATFTFDPDNP